MSNFTGTAAANTIIGTASADTILGLGGNDVLRGRGGNDTIDGGAGNDRITGGTGNDTLTGGTGNDTFVFAAGCGQDRVTDLGSGDVVQISGYSAAQSVAQVGSDVVVTLSSSDKLTFSNATVATVQAALHFGTSTGGSTGSTITGTSGNDTLNGTAGNDVITGLAGHDVIQGGAGNDRISGGLGGDDLYGGAGADVFVYSSAAEGPPRTAAQWDTIHDFQSIDKIDLSGIDANTLVAGNQAFYFAGYLEPGQFAPDHSAGALYIRGGGETNQIIAFTDNDTSPDFFLELVEGSGQAFPTTDNFIL